jgi:hypothetical protein
MLTLVEAARTAQTTAVAISELAETGKLHFAVTPEGQQFICFRSLAAASASGPETALMIPQRHTTFNF